jgi:hypothetical protein
MIKKMKHCLKIFTVLLLAVSIISCDEEFVGDVVKDNLPEIPVVFEGATTEGFNPYYTVSYANGNFSITVTIPEDSPTRISEVTNVVAGTTAINVASLTNAKQYLTGPAAVNGYSYTLTTSLTEFNAKAISGAIAAAPAAGVLTERAFMFSLTMEDGSKIVPVQCRIRVTP